MREIEFRGRWRDTKRIIHNFCENYNIAECNSEHFIVEQYTGQIDSNGVKIYEGDILVNPHRKEDARKFLVQWDVDCSRFLAVTIPLEANAGENRYLWYVGKELNKNGLVIGNIHDTPELFEEQDAKV